MLRGRQTLARHHSDFTITGFNRVRKSLLGGKIDLSRKTPLEREKPDWMAERIGFELLVAFAQHSLQACSDWKSRIMVAKSASASK